MLDLAIRPTPRFITMTVAAIAASGALFATMDSADAFPRGGAMRPMIAKPQGPIARPYGAMSNVEYTVTVTDTQTGRARRPAMHLRNANASDPGNVEVVVKVLDGRPAPIMRPGKFRVIEHEPLRSNFRAADQVYIPGP